MRGTAGGQHVQLADVWCTHSIEQLLALNACCQGVSEGNHVSKLRAPDATDLCEMTSICLVAASVQTQMP